MVYRLLMWLMIFLCLHTPGFTLDFGYTTAPLPLADSENGSLLLAQEVTLSEPGTLQSLSMHIVTAAGFLRLGLYAPVGAGGSPGSLLAQTPEFAPSVGWNTRAVIVPVSLSAGTYWLAFWPSSNSLAFSKITTSDPPSRWYTLAYTNASLPTTFSTSSNTSTSDWPLYGTVTTETLPAPASGVSVTFQASVQNPVNLTWMITSPA